MRLPKFSRKFAKPLVVLAAVVLVGIGSSLGYAYALKTKHPDEAKQVLSISKVASPTPTVGSSPSPAPSPSPTTALLAGMNVTPKAAIAPVSPAASAKSSAANVTASPALPPLGIAGAEVTASSAQCSSSQINVTLDYINLTASSTVHPNTLVKAYVDYPNGESSSEQTLYFAAMSPATSTPVSPDSRYISFDLTAGITPADVLFRVRVVSPVAYTSGWMGIPLSYYCPNMGY